MMENCGTAAHSYESWVTMCKLIKSPAPFFLLPYRLQYPPEMVENKLV